jgi:hypothetical protein
VLQVEGEKVWDIWRPTKELPMRLSEDSYSSEEVAARSRSDPLLRVTLKAGDSLYLPRGFIHRARTEGVRSLHATVSAMVDRWVDVAALATARGLANLRDDPELRASIPFGREALTAPTNLEADRYRDLAETFIRSLPGHLDRAYEDIRSQSAHVPPPTRGRFVDLVQEPDVDASTIVRFRDKPLGSVRIAGGRSRLLCGPDEYVLDPQAERAFAWAQSVRRFRAGGLGQGLTPDDSVALTRRLIEFGICTVTA